MKQKEASPPSPGSAGGGDKLKYKTHRLLELESRLTIAEGKAIQSHFELRVFQLAETTAMELFELSKGFPKEERFSLTDQLRRSSRAVAAAISESWRRRRYPAAFVSKLNEAEAEAAEAQTWIRFACRCRYIDGAVGESLIANYEAILRTLVGMARHQESWTGRVGYNADKE
jgi:four helix bundle protein